MAERPATRRGPRGAGADTRGAVLAAARARFAAHGYEATRLRDVATDAGVVVALVSFHFGRKDGLFAAALSRPVHPAQLVAELAGGGVDGLGERLVRRLVALLDQRAGDGFVAAERTRATNERAAELLRGFVEREVLAPLAAAIDADRPELRAALCGSQLVGIVLARRVIGVRPLAQVDPDTLAAAVGPTLQRYLTGPLT